MTVFINVLSPSVEGNRVHYAWEQSVPNLLQNENSFFYSYPDIPLDQFTTEFWLEILLAVQLRVWKQQGEQVQVTMPQPLPQSSIDFWSAYHDAPHVQIGPTRPGHELSVWSDFPGPGRETFETAVYFGGGKDSLTMAGMLGELIGRDQVLLVRGHNPVAADPKVWQAIRQNFEDLSLTPLQQAGFHSTTFASDFASNAVVLQIDTVRVGYEKFLVPSLPILLHYGVQISSLGLTWIDFYHYEQPGQQRHPVRHLWRPEGLGALSRHYQRALGFDHQVCDFNMLTSTEVIDKILIHRYPDLVPFINSCGRTRDGRRWCLNCPKCFSWARHTLSEGMIDPEFGYEQFFTSDFIEEVLSLAKKQGAPRGVNVPYFVLKSTVIVAPWHYLDITNCISQIDPMLVMEILSDKAFGNLAMLLRYFGNSLDPRTCVVPGDVIARLPQPLGRQLAEIAGTVVPIVDHVAGPLTPAGTPLHFALAETFPHALLDVEHIREID